ncbi:interleukin-17F-like [Seriola lalandi dorsalis]|uniref:Interleukin 17a/f3 n=1 Tax=Seriola lalandi dorsalis TaxID=1841481 RepID=A0A3B4YCJ6_SERLL|nr:interleukin-17F-like [Seriola lalandi dorsalis]XP_056219218.1 interleukin 17a/f3 [Seriola aureovittata]
MLLLLRAVLVLGLAASVHTTRKRHAISVKLEKGTGTKEKVVRLVLDPSVQPQIVSMSALSIANMSLSPWTYRDSYDASRWPQRISHAQCQTSGCLSLQGEGEDSSLDAQPIYYQVLVLHRVPRQRQNNKGGRKGKKYEYRLGMEVITVGCTCVRPSVVPQ